MGFRNPITTATDPTARAAAAAAQGTANAAYNTAATKTTVYGPSATAPTAPAGGFTTGDQWVQSLGAGQGVLLQQWTGSAWSAQQYGAGSLAAGAVVAGTVAAGAIDGQTITGATVQTATSGARVVLDSTNGLRGFAGNGTVSTQLDTTGKLTATGATIAGGFRTGTSGPRIELLQSPGTTGASGALSFFAGVQGEVASTVTRSSNYTDQGGGVVTMQGHALILDSGSSNMAGPQLALSVAAAPAGGYEAVSTLTGARVVLPLVRIPSTGDVAPPTTVGGAVSTGHPFQIGPDTGQRTLWDNNEMASVTTDASGNAILGSFGMTASNVGISANLAGVADLRLNGTQGTAAYNATRKDYVDGKSPTTAATYRATLTKSVASGAALAPFTGWAAATGATGVSSYMTQTGGVWTVVKAGVYAVAFRGESDATVAGSSFVSLTIAGAAGGVELVPQDGAQRSTGYPGAGTLRQTAHLTSYLAAGATLTPQVTQSTSNATAITYFLYFSFQYLGS